MPSLIFLLIYLNWRLIALQCCGGFCRTLTWISHRCTCVPYPEPPSHLPPHPIPQGCPSAPALSALFHASNLDWWSISHIVIFMFQCCFLKSSHSRLLPHSPKVCSLYLCLFAAEDFLDSPGKGQLPTSTSNIARAISICIYNIIYIYIIYSKNTLCVVKITHIKFMF